jgi:hypothetical protein
VTHISHRINTKTPCCKNVQFIIIGKFTAAIQKQNTLSHPSFSPLLPSCVKGAIAQEEFLSVQNNKTKF